MLARCPQTGGCTTRMVKSVFDARCAELIAEKTKNGAPVHEFCQICTGYPAEVEFVNLEDYNMAKNGKLEEVGICAECGEKKRLKKHLNEMVCSTCQLVRGLCNKRPGYVITILTKLGKMPGQLLQETPDSARLETVIKERDEARVKIQSLEEHLEELCKEAQQNQALTAPVPALHIIDTARIVRIGREMAFTFGTDNRAAISREDVEFLLDGAVLPN